MATRPAYVYNGSGWDDIGDKRIGAEAGDIPQASVEDLTSDLASKAAASDLLILDVKSVTKTDTFTASVAGGGNVAVTDLTITHTLQSSSNKLLFMAFFGVAAHDEERAQVGIAIANDGTLIGIADADGNRTQVTAGGEISGSRSSYIHTMPHIHFLYAPGDTNSHTYTLRAINVNQNTSTLYINRGLINDNVAARSLAVSALTLMEVAA